MTSLKGEVAVELLEALKAMVDWYGIREGVLSATDALLPASLQNPEVARAMAAIAKASTHPVMEM